MYNSTNLMNRESVKNESNLTGELYNGINYSNSYAQTTKKVYTSPSIRFVMNENTMEQKKTIETSEDAQPSSTTMQFKGGENLEDFVALSVNTKKELSQDYKINTKGKVLIAIYALIFVTIMSLSIANSHMLKRMDNEIKDYNEEIVQMTMEYDALSEKLNYVSSDLTIEAKATEMGMEKAE